MIGAIAGLAARVGASSAGRMAAFKASEETAAASTGRTASFAAGHQAGSMQRQSNPAPQAPVLTTSVPIRFGALHG